MNTAYLIKGDTNLALRNHSLDNKIIDAAFNEFLKKGYRDASLREIAKIAGVTVGAIQIRYKSKDELFTCLLTSFLEEIKIAFENTKIDYFSKSDKEFLTKLELSMKNESNLIIHLIFDHYEEAVLLLCKSDGSSLENYFDTIIQKKIKESIFFFESMDHKIIDENLLRFLISMQFDCYRRIVNECNDCKAAEKYMNDLMTYHLGGWKFLFESKSK